MYSVIVYILKQKHAINDTQHNAETLQERLLHVINKRRFNGQKIISQIIKRERGDL